MPHDAGYPEPTNPMSAAGARERQPVIGRIDPPHTTTQQRIAPVPTPITPPGLNSAPDVMSLLAALRHRWISAVLLGGTLAVIAAVSVYYLLTPRNSAYAQLKVAFYEPVIGEKPLASIGDFKTYLQTTAGEIKSRGIIISALKRDEVRKHNLQQKEIDPAQTIYEDLTVEFKENSELVTILFNHADPDIAVAVVKEIREAYLEDIVEAKKTAKSNRVTELEKAYESAVDKLKAKKDSLNKTLRTMGTADPKIWREQRLEMSSAKRDAQLQQSQVGYKLIESQAALIAIDARIKSMEKSDDSSKKVEAKKPTVSDEELKAALAEAIEKALDSDPDIRLLQQKVTRAQEETDEYASRGFRPDYTSYKSARERLAMYQKQLDSKKKEVSSRVKVRTAAKPIQQPQVMTVSIQELQAQREQMVQQVKALSKVDEGLREYIEKLAKEMAKVPTLAADYDQLAAEISRDEEILKELGSRLERERLELRAASRITRFQNADLLKKDTKKQLLAAAVSPFAAIFAVCAGLSWVEFRKRRIRNAEEISRGLGIRVVGAVPHVNRLERQLVGAAGESELEGTPVMESIDAIRTRLLHEADVRSTRIVMVTSAGHGEGKTTVAGALASSLARAGRRTLLVDGDLRKPMIHELFELPMQPGFSEALLAEIEVNEVAQETPQENLYVLSAGQWDREVLQSLARGGLEGIFERLSEEFDFIIVDSHPALAATDSLLIGRQVDAVILSVLRGVSQMHRVYAVQQQLTGLGIRVMGAVVSGMTMEDVFATPAVTAGAV